VKGLVRVLSFLFLVCLPVAAQTQQTIRVNAGGPVYTDSKGHAWSADYGFNTGSLSHSAPSANVTGTADPTLFKSARVGTSSGADLQYQFAVTDGLYNVNLYFAETYFTAVAQRVFDVQMQGTTVFSALDIFAVAGLDHALVKSAQVSVTNGQLIIRFAHRANGNVPVIAALEILPAGSSSSLQFSTSSLPAGQVGAAYSTMIQATGGTTPFHWSISSGALPAGLTLSATTGTISGTPTTSGSFTFTAKVTDSTTPAAQTATKSLTITVASVASPVQITTSSLPSGQAAVPYSTTLAAIDGTSPYKWSITSGALPAGLTLASSGTISGTPTTSGTFSFTVHVADSASSPTSASANLSITIAAASTYSVMLNWTASPSPGVTGYNVYRSTVAGSGYTKINSPLVSGLTYTDATVVNGVTYYYVTTSVNASGDESSYSEQVQMIVP
jgi:Malectin domain/Putative Ig domain